MNTLTRVRISTVELTHDYVVLTLGTEDPQKVKFRHNRVGDVLVYLLRHPGPAVAHNKAAMEDAIQEMDHFSFSLPDDGEHSKFPPSPLPKA